MGGELFAPADRSGGHVAPRASSAAGQLPELLYNTCRPKEAWRSVGVPLVGTARPKPMEGSSKAKLVIPRGSIQTPDRASEKVASTSGVGEVTTWTDADTGATVRRHCAFVGEVQGRPPVARARSADTVNKASVPEMLTPRSMLLIWTVSRLTEGTSADMRSSRG